MSEQTDFTVRTQKKVKRRSPRIKLRDHSPEIIIDHDERQLCLSFIVPRIPPFPVEKTARRIPTREQLEAHWQHGFAKLPQECHRVFFYERGVEQYTLLFPDKRKISMLEYSLLKELDFPGFERNAEGRLAKVYKSDRVFLGHDFEIWCDENCIDRYYVAGVAAYFMRYRDATLAKLFMIND